MILGACTDAPMMLGSSTTDQALGGEQVDMLVSIERPPPQEGELVNYFGPRAEVQSCQLPPPPQIGTLTLTAASPHRFQRPLWYDEPPLLTPWSFVAEQGGKIFAYQESLPDQPPTQFFDITVSRLGNEEGLLGLAFHPQLATDPYLYTYYSSAGCSSPNIARCSILSRWTLRGGRLNGVGSEGQLPEVDSSSELVLMEIPQPYPNHNGGDLRFGPDGMLYISLGDGGAGGDPVNHAQRPETLLGSILRINVNETDPTCQTHYSIPEDNPFYNNRCDQEGGGLPEVWAWGLRNSWRMSFDRETGALWAADVGQDRWEEVNRIEGGKNYGWRPVEGPECYTPNCDLSAYEPPIHSYDHSIGRSITGGFVYRGEQLPGLRGYYVFSDFESAKVMAFPLESPEDRLILSSGNQRFTSFGETRTGDLRLLSFDGPSVLKLEPRTQQTDSSDFPTLLSETGCYSDISAGRLAPSVIPYEVNLPFWSDEAEKERAFALPAGQKMRLREPGVGFDFPSGTVLIKTFYLRSQDGERRRFETRLMHHSDRGWIGYTYRWKEDESDAILMTQAEEHSYQGPRGEQTWSFLSQSACLQCHTAAANRTLGLELQQLNKRVITENGWYDQLTALAESDYLVLTEASEELASFKDLSSDQRVQNEEPRTPAEQASFIDRHARAYLHINCSPCHRPDGAATVNLDMRYATPLSESGLCNAEPLHGDLGVNGARHLIPGSPDKSLVILRVNHQGEERMPPMGSHLVDFGGVALLSLWVSQLQSCD